MKIMDLVFAIIFVISVFACLLTITSRLKEEINEAKVTILEMKKDSDANKEDLKTAFHMMRHRIDTLEKNQKINSEDIQKIVDSVNNNFNSFIETDILKPQSELDAIMKQSLDDIFNNPVKPQTKTKKKSKKKDISKEN